MLKDRQNNTPSNVMMAVAGGGLLWLGWSGFNGGDPYFANADASAAVLNTHLCTATALLVWMIMDIFFLKKPTIIGMISGMIAGLVAITPGAGYVNAYAAFAIGVGAGVLPWLSMNVLGKTRLFTGRVDDTLGVIYTHGIAGLLGGLLVGVFADPNMAVFYTTTAKKGALIATGSAAGVVHGSFTLLKWQVFAGAWVICDQWALPLPPPTRSFFQAGL